MSNYIHGYSDIEKQRLISQNNTLSKYIYDRIDLRNCDHILELGCGVGAQMIYILNEYPNIKITGIDISKNQLSEAKHNLDKSKISKERYTLLHSSELDEKHINNFDGLLIIWVLEHVDDPAALILSVRPYIQEKSPIFVTEVQHSNFQITPENKIVDAFWEQAIQYQYKLGGNPNIGSSLKLIFNDIGINNGSIEPYHLSFSDQQLNAKIEMYNYWIKLMESEARQMIINGELSKKEWELVVSQMLKNKNTIGSTFSYAFIQGFGLF